MATARPRTRGGNRPGPKGTRGFDRSRAKSWKYKKKGEKDTEDEPTTAVADKPVAAKPVASKPVASKPVTAKPVTATTSEKVTPSGGTDTKGFGDIPTPKDDTRLIPSITTSPLTTKKMETETPSTRPIGEKTPSIPASSTATTVSPIIGIDIESDTGDEPPISRGDISPAKLSASANPDLAEDITLDEGGPSVERIARLLKGITDPTVEQSDPDNFGEKLGSNEPVREHFIDIDPNVTIADTHPKSDSPSTDAVLEAIVKAEVIRRQEAEDLKALGIAPRPREPEPTEEDLRQWADWTRERNKNDESSGSGGGSGGGSEGARKRIEGLTEDGDPYYIDENGEAQLVDQYLIDSLGYFDDLNEVEEQILAEIKAGRRKLPRTN